MLRTCASLVTLLACCQTAAAQGFGSSTGFGQTNTSAAQGLAGAAGQGGAPQSGTGSVVAAGSGFSFDPRFGTTAVGNAFSTGVGGLGGIGGIGGIGGLGGIGGGRLGGGLGGFGGGFGGGGFGGGGFGGRGGFGQNQQQQNQSKIRATIKVGFDYQAPPPQSQAIAIQNRLARLPIPQRFDQAQIQFVGRQAVVRGTFEDPEDIAVLRQLLLLEPGVEEVDVSQAVVVVSPAELVPPPPPAF